MNREEFNKIYDKWLSENKTSWKFLDRKGMLDAEYFGDCVFLNYNGIEEKKDHIKEFILSLLEKPQEESKTSKYLTKNWRKVIFFSIMGLVLFIVGKVFLRGVF